MAKDKVTTHLACEKCKSRNYTRRITKKGRTGALILKKYCPRPSCRLHTAHKETK